MKSRSQELIDKSVAAMISAIEIYNKPDFKYREETFSILAINAWELLLKAKWLNYNGNKIRSLYVTEKKNKLDGKPYKYPKIKLTECGNPFTHNLDFLATKLREKKILAEPALKNIKALSEIRDSAVHFYNRNNLFAIRLQEVGSAAVKNFVTASHEWFKVDLTKFNFYLMPLAFVTTNRKLKAVSLNKEEKKLAGYISELEAESGSTEGEYAVSVNIEVKFSRSKANDALNVKLTNDPSATKLYLTEEQIKDKYPFDYKTLTKECRKRYSNFVINKKYHQIKSSLKNDKKYCLVRHLDPGNSRSPRKEWYSQAIFTELDKHYEK